MSRDIEREVRKRYAERRERIATAVMAGLVANPGGPLQARADSGWGYVNGGDPELVAIEARELADALIAELDDPSEVEKW